MQMRGTSTQVDGSLNGQKVGASRAGVILLSPARRYSSRDAGVMRTHQWRGDGQGAKLKSVPVTARAVASAAYPQTQGAVALDRMVHLAWGLSGGDSAVGADDQQPYVH